MFDSMRRNFILEAARFGNFVDVARKMLIDKATVTRNIKAEEEELGIKLFERVKGSMSPTPAGRRYIELAKQIEIYAADFKGRVLDTEDLSRGVVRIGGSRSFMQNLIYPLVCEFHAKYPRVEFVTTTGGDEKLLGLMTNEMLDLALVQDVSLSKFTYASIPILDMKPLVIVPKQHPLALRHAQSDSSDFPLVEWKELDGVDFVGLTSTHPLHEAFWELRRKTKCEPRIWITVDNAFTATWVAAYSNSVTLSSLNVANSVPEFKERIVVMRLADKMASRRLVLAYDNQKTMTRASKGFMKMITEKLVAKNAT